MNAWRTAWRSLRQTGRTAGAGVRVEWFGSGAILSADDDSPYRLWQLLTAAAVPSDDFLIVPSGRALRQPGGIEALRETTLRAAEESGRGRIWIAAAGLGRPDDAHAGWLHRISARTGVRLLAPDGRIEATPDGTLYVAGATGGWGWRSFLEEGRCPVAGNRCPLPDWERVLPDRSIPVGGLWLDPVPAGVALRAGAVPTGPGHAAFRVPVDPDGPTVVIRHAAGRAAEPARIAEVFAGLPARVPVRIEVRHDGGPRPDPDWLDALAGALHGAAGPAGRRPVRQVIFQPAALIDLGWQRTGQRLFRSHAEPRLLAEVVPAGILIRPDGVYAADGLAVFDPRTRTLTVGADGVTASAALVEPLSRMLAGAPADPAGPVRLTLAGETDRVWRDQLIGAALRGGLLTGTDAPGVAVGPAVMPPVTVDHDVPAGEKVLAGTARWPGYDALERDSDEWLIGGLPEPPPATAPSAQPVSSPATTSGAWPVSSPAVASGARPVSSPVVASGARPATSPAAAFGVRPESSPATGPGARPEPGSSTWAESSSATASGGWSKPVPAEAPGGWPAPVSKPAARDEGIGAPVADEKATMPAAHPMPDAQPILADALTPGFEPAMPGIDTPLTPSVDVPAVPSVAAPMTPAGMSPAVPGGRPPVPPVPPAGLGVVVTSGPGPAGDDAPVPDAAGHVPPAAMPVLATAPARTGGDLESGADDQAAFAAGLGSNFHDSITTVNAALAAWPALRRDTSPAAKTDLVAVRTYLSHPTLGAPHLNAVLRAGRDPEPAGYVPCLVSGLDRLPPCRRVLLTQGRLPAPATALYREGAILVEPGFRNVGGSLTHTVPHTDVDYLIWSRDARQITMLSEFPGFDEAVFLAGTRFKVLAVRGAADEGKTKKEVRVPPSAVLLRELLPGESSPAGELDEADRSALGRLDRALTRRRAATSAPIEDPEHVARLVGPPLGYVDAPGGAA